MTRRSPSSTGRSPLGIFLIGFPLSVLLWCLILAGLAALMGCQTTGSGATRAPPPMAVACLAFKPIRWSKDDTPETQKQARAHNAAGASLCGWKP